MKRSGGFTLIECLVALLIIAIVLASATKAIGMSVEDVHNNYVREAAMWVANNQISQYYLDGTYPNLGVTKQNTNIANIDFIVNTDISATGNQYFRKVEISLSETKTPDYIIYKTVSFISQY
ncbi:MAG: type II secretion system minor pseudopilin GspI [Burkholderiales bacterium]|nr:type II secretion system minor pseudopilin GspI [Burkholderiales bacterium]